MIIYNRVCGIVKSVQFVAVFYQDSGLYVYLCIPPGYTLQYEMVHTSHCVCVCMFV